MPKTHNAHKQTMKQPLMTPKEKKAAKRAKKHKMDAPVPIITH